MNESRHEALTNVLALAAVAAALIIAAAFIASYVSPEKSRSQTASVGLVACEKFEACKQVGLSLEGDVLKQPGCQVPGFDYKITESKGKVLVEAIPQKSECNTGTSPSGLQSASAATSRFAAEETKELTCEQGERRTSSVPIGQFPPCNVEWCKKIQIEGVSREICHSVDRANNSSLGKLYDDASGSIVPRFMADLSPEQLAEALPQLNLGSIPGPAQDQINNALTTQQASIGQRITRNDSDIERLKKYADTCTSCSSGERNDVRDQVAQLEQTNSSLKKQLAGLALAQEALKPEAAPGGGPDVEIPPSGPGPRDYTFDQGPGGTPGGIGQALQGLMQGLGGGQGQGQGGAPQPGNQNPQTPGTCTPQLVCSENTLYTRSSQCVDVAIQQCPHGCSGNACAQPPGAPSAQLSCQPQLADVGMTVAITWGCSAGTSTGSGFTTNGALSGATSTVITAPPEGANTVSFGLICTNGSVSSSASCSVQVAKPAIVLVANPDKVALNETATIGWVTSGMEKCTISSPDQLDFTEENASRTNINGVAETSPITEESEFLLTCTTLGGNTREATTTVSILEEEEGSE